MIRVLVVDDERARENVARTLRHNCGMEAETASSAEECLLKLRLAHESGNEFDAVVLDIYMPGLNGDEIVQELRRDYPYLAIVMLTAYESIDTAIATLRHGAFMYLSKADFDTVKQLQPVLRAGVVQGRLKRERNSLATEKRSSEHLYERCAKIIGEAIAEKGQVYLAIASHEDGRWAIEFPRKIGDDESPKWLPENHSIVQRAKSGDVVKLHRLSDEPEICPLNHGTKSLLVVPIPKIGGSHEGFVDLEFPDERTIDSYTMDVMVSLTELVAFHRGQASRDEVELAKNRAENFDFASRQAAHFIRNALHVARNTVFEAREILDDVNQSESVTDFAKRVKEKLTLESTFDEIQDVLIQMGAIGEEVNPEFVPVNIRAIIQPRLENYEMIARHEHVQFEIEFAGGELDVVLFVDSAMIRRSLDMLVENAIEACAGMTNMAKVMLRVLVDDNSVTIAVSDNGPGISEKDFEQLFQPRFSSKQNSPLRGMGLFTAQKLITKNNGRIISQRLEKGAQFEIELPRMRNKEKA